MTELRERLAELGPRERAALEARLRPRRVKATAIARRSDPAEPAPLSFGQERLWFLHQLDPSDASYNMLLVERLRGPLDVAALERAIAGVAARHESLRSRFSSIDGRPVQIVTAETLAVEHLDVSDAAEPELRARELVAERANRPFDLSREVMRATVLRLDEEDHVLCLVLHHIVSDGWSLDVLRRELSALYRGEPLPPLSLQYSDYAAWERSAAAASTGSWKDRLAGVPALELPTDRPRPKVRTTNGGFVDCRLAAEACERLERLARDEGCSLFMALLAVYQVLLSRHSGQLDFAIGFPTAGRNRAEVRPLVGFFVNTLVLRADLAGDPTFRELLARTKAAALRAYSEQDVPFERVVNELGVDRDLGRTPLFQTMLSLGTPGGGLELPESEAEAFDSGYARAKLELWVELRREGERLAALFGYNADLFDRATVERLAERFERLLAGAADDPDRPVSSLPLLTEADERPLAASQGDVRAYRVRPLPALVAAQAARTPDAPALRFRGERLGYGELAIRVSRLARLLRARGVRPGDVVGICLERSVELVTAVHAVQAAGAAYLPLEPDYPEERLSFMAADAEARLVVTTSALAGRLAGVDTLCLDAAAEELAAQPPTPPEVALPPDAPAYVIYTSGSTGVPKGVVVSHRAIANRLLWMQETFALGPGDRVVHKTPFGFDVSVWELFWPLLAGAILVVAEPGGHRDAAYLADLIREERVTTLHFVPSMLEAFLDEPDLASRTAGLRRVLCSGEALTPALVRRFHETLPGVELHNLYGPTEAAVDVTWHPCGRGEQLVPIGRPIANTRVEVLDAHGERAPPGTPGELCIGGVQVADGYVRRPGLTAERFVPDPCGGPGARLYRTGDLARRLPTGELEFLGRSDHQVKLRGFRVEPGEIEAALVREPELRAAAVLARDDGAGPRLVGYVVPEHAPPPGPAELRRRLARTLPEHMIPSAWVVLDALPLTPNGKLDRAALPAPDAAGAAGEEGHVAPDGPVEEQIAAVWAEVLGVERVGARDDFFELGGHSLLATQVVVRLRSVLPTGTRPVSVMDVFEHRTVRALAEAAAEPEAPVHLLYELTPPQHAPELTFVCVPYGGGSASAYQPLADALSPGCALYALSLPGHDVGLADEVRPLAEVAEATVEEILARIEGPLVLYGHCAIGGALTVEIARRLEAAGRLVEAVYLGGIFPFARPGGPLAGLFRLERLRSDRIYMGWLQSLGADLGALDEEERRFFVRAMRHDARTAEDYFTDLLRSEPARLSAPIVSVVGERDQATEYYEERYREWHFLSDTTALVVLDEAGHYFLRFRADELAQIVTSAHPALVRGDETADAAEDGGATWWLHATSRASAAASEEIRPSMRRFLAVAAAQLVSIAGSAVTAFAIPIWIYLATGSLGRYALFVILGLLPGVAAAPLAGAIVDRANRRTIMILGDGAAAFVQLGLGALLWTDRLRIWHLYPLAACLSVVLAFQRLAYASAVPQLVPKRYLGHANGILQTVAGTAQFTAPLAAVWLIGVAGLDGIVLLDVVSFFAAVAVVGLVRFPAAMAHTQREPIGREIVNGFRYSLGRPGFRAMIAFFAVSNLALAPLILSLSPLVLSFDSLMTAGRVALVAGLGAVAGGLVLTLWGGPGRRRMRGVLLAGVGLGAFAMLVGARPSAAVVGAGAFGLFLFLALLNGIYSLIVMVKVPQRFHGRVFALNQMIAWSTLPLGFAVVAPLGERLFEPLLANGGALAPTIGRVIGVGAGRGLAFMYVVLGLTLVLEALLAFRIRALARFDEDVPDATPDDLVGVDVLGRRRRKEHSEAGEGGRDGRERRHARVRRGQERRGAALDPARPQGDPGRLDGRGHARDEGRVPRPHRDGLARHHAAQRAAGPRTGDGDER